MKSKARKATMTAEGFKASLAKNEPPAGISSCLAALWWDARGDWRRAHELVDELETRPGMAVHAYLHRKEGDASNADYWYRRAARPFEKRPLEEEWASLLEELLRGS